MNSVKGLNAHLLETRDGVFHDWKPFLDKHFDNMDGGLIHLQLFEFKDGVVKYQKLNDDGEAVTMKQKVF